MGILAHCQSQGFFSRCYRRYLLSQFQINGIHLHVQGCHRQGDDLALCECQGMGQVNRLSVYANIRIALARGSGQDIRAILRGGKGRIDTCCSGRHRHCVAAHCQLHRLGRISRLRFRGLRFCRLGFRRFRFCTVSFHPHHILLIVILAGILKAHQQRHILIHFRQCQRGFAVLRNRIGGIIVYAVANQHHPDIAVLNGQRAAGCSCQGIVHRAGILTAGLGIHLQLGDRFGDKGESGHGDGVKFSTDGIFKLEINQLFLRCGVGEGHHCHIIRIVDLHRFKGDHTVTVVVGVGAAVGHGQAGEITGQCHISSLHTGAIANIGTLRNPQIPLVHTQRQGLTGNGRAAVVALTNQAAGNCLACFPGLNMDQNGLISPGIYMDKAGVNAIFIIGIRSVAAGDSQQRVTGGGEAVITGSRYRPAVVIAFRSVSSQLVLSRALLRDGLGIFQNAKGRAGVGIRRKFHRVSDRLIGAGFPVIVAHHQIGILTRCQFPAFGDRQLIDCIGRPFFFHIVQLNAEILHCLSDGQR